MSWAGQVCLLQSITRLITSLLRFSFKKSVNRAGTTVSKPIPLNLRLSCSNLTIDFQLLQKTGQIERTIDREFTEEEAKYKMYAKRIWNSRTSVLICRCCVLVSRRNVKLCKKMAKLIGMQCEVRSILNPRFCGLHILLG